MYAISQYCDIQKDNIYKTHVHKSWDTFKKCNKNEKLIC